MGPEKNLNLKLVLERFNPSIIGSKEVTAMALS